MRPAAVVFDLYGTLLDFGSLAGTIAAAGIPDAPALLERWRTKQIEYAWCSTLMDEYRDFDTLTARALAYVLEAHGVALDPDAQKTLAQAWLTLPIYGDVAPTLVALRAAGYPLAVLTNGTRVSAERALRSAGIRDHIDELLSVEAVRAYKPDPRVYKLATAKFACDPEQILFVSSNGWDASGAAAFGYRVAWCNRAKRANETLGFAPAYTLAALPELTAFVA